MPEASIGMPTSCSPISAKLDNWCAALDAPHERLRRDDEILPELAEAGLVDAGKDISQGGIVGTALMLAESSRCGFDIALADIPRPQGVQLERWLRSFPSFGFVLSVRPERANEVCSVFAARGIAAAAIGHATDSSRIELTSGGARATFWDYAAAPYIALAKEIAYALSTLHYSMA